MCKKHVRLDQQFLPCYNQQMHEVLKSTNLVTISFACHLLDEHEIEYFLFDAQISAMEGSIGAFPRRLMVIQQDLHMAKRILSDADLL